MNLCICWIGLNVVYSINFTLLIYLWCLENFKRWILVQLAQFYLGFVWNKLVNSCLYSVVSVVVVTYCFKLLNNVPTISHTNTDAPALAGRAFRYLTGLVSSKISFKRLKNWKCKMWSPSPSLLNQQNAVTGFINQFGKIWNTYTK